VPGTARLLTFSVRALALLLLISILWLYAAKAYNGLLTAFAKPFLPDGLSIKVLGTGIYFQAADSTYPVAIDGLTLHYGLILLAVIVLAAVGISILPRIGWLVTLSLGTFLTHIAGVALLAHGVSWVASSEFPDESSRIMFSLFAASWGLLPALAGGIWCVMYWIPAVSRGAAPLPSKPEAVDAPLSSS
jgi:hypothetical protein